MFVNKNDLKHVTPMKNRNLDMKFLEVFLVKCELASDRLSFLSKMGLEFFSTRLEFFLKTHKKRAWTINKVACYSITRCCFSTILPAC